MEYRKLLDIMAVLEKLKCSTRHSWTSTMRRESVAEHCWRLSMLAWFMHDEFPETDIGRVMLMCLAHDIGEVFTGDIPAFYKTDGDDDAEARAVEKFVDSLPEPYCSELRGVFREIAEGQTEEAKLFLALDNMEAVIQHNEAPIDTWLHLEYTVNLDYGEKRAAFSDWLAGLRAVIKNDSIEKIKTEGHK